jgi:chorismate mutase/prephenate dehydratase
MSDRRTDEVYARLEDIDREILRSVERRARLVEDLIKQRTGNAVLLPIVDGAHLAALERAAQGTLPPAAVRAIFEAIDAACRVYEVAPKVTYVGVEGGFGFLAARAQFGARAELHAAHTNLAALDDVSRSRADFAVVPYESLEEGPQFETIQAIVASDLKLVGERHVAQALSLIATSADVETMDTIYAVPAHRVACEGYLAHHHPRATVHEVRSPQAALESLGASPTAGAIVPRGTPLAPAPVPTGTAVSNGSSDACNLVIARESIADAGESRVRWGVVSRLPMPRTGNDATAVVFGIHDRPGALHDILGHFKERDCSLRRIHSRAVRAASGWDYLFYAEVGGHVTDRPLTSALEGVKREARTLHVVGSFPVDDPAPPASSHAR